MKLFRTISLLFALVAVPAVASAETTTDAPTVETRDHRAKKMKKRWKMSPAKRAMKRIEKLDVDNNGGLSLAEVKGTRLEARFDQIDRNDNGILSKGELVSAIKQHRAKMKKGKGHRKGKRRGHVIAKEG